MTQITGKFDLPYAEPLTLRFEARVAGASLLPGLKFHAQTDLVGNYDFTLPPGDYGFVYYNPSQGTSRPHRITVPAGGPVTLSALLDPTYTAPVVLPGDTTGPIVTAPSNSSLQFINGGAGLTHNDSNLLAWLATASATDETAPVSPTVTNNLATHPNPLTVGAHVITFSATDSAGNTGTASATLTVSEASAGNTAPSISAQTFNRTDADSIGTSFGPVVASDADLDTLSYSVSGTAFTINISTGVLTWAEAPSVGSTQVTVTVDDGTVTAQATITVNVSFTPVQLASYTFDQFEVV